MKIIEVSTGRKLSPTEIVEKKLIICPLTFAVAEAFIDTTGSNGAFEKMFINWSWKEEYKLIV